MKKVNAIVLRTAGTNCNKETVWALKLAGAYRVDEVHINRLKENKSLLDKYHILVLPGGFTYGDYVSAGKIFANEIKFLVFENFIKFIKKGKIVLGICNGFQILIKLGILSSDTKNFNQTFSLVENDSKRFECRWVYLKIKNSSIFLKNLPDIISLPVAHNEGKFVFQKEKDIQNLIALKYCMPDGNDENVEYPFNPNGSFLNIAGITNKEGNVLGLMPHPERFIFPYHYPLFYYMKHNNQKIIPWGLQIFKNIIEFS